MQNVLVDVHGDVEDFVAIILDAYAFRTVLLLSIVAPVGHDVFLYRLDWKMLEKIHRVFAHEDYVITRLSRSDHIFGQ